MKLGSSNILGIAVSDRSITCAELSGRSDRRAIRKTAAFTIADGVSFDRPDALGEMLRAFLQKEGFTATRAVVGVPAKWVIAAEREVPPASEEQVKAMLRLQAERMKVTDSDELVTDYVGASSRDKPARVLLVGMLRKQLEKVRKTVEIAGLQVAAVTSTSLALATAVNRAAGQQTQTPLLVLTRTGAEVVWRHHGVPRMIRHVGTSVANGNDPPALTPLGQELRRTVAMIAAPPVNGQGLAPAPRELQFWDTVGLTDSQVGELAERVGMELRPGDGMTALGVASPVTTGRQEAARFAPAVALAVVAEDARLPLDFTDSRLAPPRQRKVGRATAGAVAAGIVLAGLLAWLFVDVQMRRSELSRINKSLDQCAPEVKAAEELADKVKYTRGFFTTRTPLLPVLREVTNCFRDSDPIWATRFNLKENRKGEIEVTLDGKTTDRAVARELSDRLRGNPNFVSVTLPSLTESAPGRSRDQVVSFSINFKYVTAEAKQ